MKLLPIFLLILVPASRAADKPDNFNSIVKRVEEHYGKSHTKVPLMGLVSFASHFTRPVGASDFKLAIIEGVDSRDESLPEFNPGSEWRPVIRTSSRHGGHVVIFGHDDGHAIKTLVVTVSDDSAVVMQMRLDLTHFAKMLSDKSIGMESLTDHGHRADY
jgi:hypothetical protein